MTLRLIRLVLGAAVLAAAAQAAACGESRPTAELAEQETVLQVGGMVCESCSQALTAALLKLDGVRAAQVEHVSGRAVIHHDPRRAARAELIATITRLGYTVASP